MCRLKSAYIFLSFFDISRFSSNKNNFTKYKTIRRATPTRQTNTLFSLNLKKLFDSDLGSMEMIL
jgi:hypothetical protein